MENYYKLFIIGTIGIVIFYVLWKMNKEVNKLNEIKRKEIKEAFLEGKNIFYFINNTDSVITINNDKYIIAKDRFDIECFIGNERYIYLHNCTLGI